MYEKNGSFDRAWHRREGAMPLLACLHVQTALHASTGCGRGHLAMR